MSAVVTADSVVAAVIFVAAIAVSVAVSVAGAVADVGAEFRFLSLTLAFPINVLGASSSASPWFAPHGRTSPGA